MHLQCQHRVTLQVRVTDRRDEKCVQNFGWKPYIRMDLKVKGWKSVDWIHLAQDREQWRALMNSVMNLRVP